jgi:hypothetical protein
LHGKRLGRTEGNRGFSFCNVLTAIACKSPFTVTSENYTNSIMEGKEHLRFGKEPLQIKNLNPKHREPMMPVP